MKSFAQLSFLQHNPIIKTAFSFLSLLSLIKIRLQKQQQEQQQQQQQQTQPVSITGNKMTTHDDKICAVGAKQADNNDNVINSYDSTSGESDDDASVELWSNEIPVYIKGEQRWISGVTEQTTCLDIIEALLIDEGVVKATEDGGANASGVNLYPTKVNEYVITERWRRMEQALDGRTKILKIWSSWGTEQSEVSAHNWSEFIISQLRWQERARRDDEWERANCMQRDYLSLYAMFI
jgi:hypothetical protein